MRAKLIELLLRGFALFSLRQVHVLGTIVGWCMLYIPNRLRETVATNIKLCYPNLSPNQKEKLRKQSIIETGKTIAEAGPQWLWPSEQLMSLVKEGPGVNELKATLAQSKGAIIAAPHLGAWEIIGLYCSTLHPMTSLYRPPRMQELAAFVRKGRERLGARLVPTDAQGIRALFRALGQHELVGILPDQDPGRQNGIFAPFFGYQANTMTLLSRLAIKTNTPVFFMFAERLPHGRGYRIHCRRGIEAINAAPLERSVALLNKEVEACVNQIPEQYQWSYKRFKTRPSGEPSIY